jgi:hypothetical protein
MTSMIDAAILDRARSVRPDLVVTAPQGSPAPPPFDRVAVREHIDLLHRLAAGLDGVLVLVGICEAPKIAINQKLERYAALPADFIKANAGDRFTPSLHCIDWGEP